MIQGYQDIIIGSFCFSSKGGYALCFFVFREF